MIGQTRRGIDEVRRDRDSLARYIADGLLRGEQPSVYTLSRYRDLSTDLRDMWATNDDVVALRQAVAS